MFAPLRLLFFSLISRSDTHSLPWPTEPDRVWMPSVPKLDQAVLPLGPGEQLREAPVKATRNLFVACVVPLIARSRANADDTGGVYRGHEWEEEVIIETGGDFLSIHVSVSSRRPGLLASLSFHGVTVPRTTADPRRGCHRTRHQDPSTDEGGHRASTPGVAIGHVGERGARVPSGATARRGRAG